MNFNFKNLLRTGMALLLAVLLPLSGSVAQDRRPLFFYVFVHDDIPVSERAHIRADYFSWLIKDLESFTGRRVYLEIIQDTPPLTAFDYQTRDLPKGLQGWTKLVERYIQEKNLPRNRTSKYLLLTRDKINADTFGYTRIGHHAAVASMQTYPAAAHEIGHMLGGTHENAEILFRNGWWCETNITASREAIRANCYVYSDRNKKIIAEQLSRAP
ncbi:hypothetical protein [Pseudomonas sp. NPDC089734]|uniref:hypothetical protein n=1 Tax=Pseudomonas sp. NPDC089734 TaxID=3364469 RepID=UPI0037FEBD09